MKKQVVVITGASSGIGLAAAELFAKKGNTVYGIAKDACQSRDVPFDVRRHIERNQNPRHDRREIEFGPDAPERNFQNETIHDFGSNRCRNGNNRNEQGVQTEVINSRNESRNQRDTNVDHDAFRRSFGSDVRRTA